MRRLAALLACLAFASPALADKLTVFAAASLREALDAAASAFEAASGHQVVVSYAASNALARQIEAGAPADLFVSADVDWVHYVEQKGLTAPGSRRNLYRNDLVLIAPAQSTVQLKLVPGVNLGAALAGGRIALANPAAVPAGRYARAALSALGAWAPVENRVAAADNVRAALALVARGEAPLGVVYRTDALAEKGVRIVDTFPPATHPPIVYPIVQVRGAKPAARALSEFLASAPGRAAVERFGFQAP